MKAIILAMYFLGGAGFSPVQERIPDLIPLPASVFVHVDTE